MRAVKKLSCEELKDIYQANARKDFPGAEMRPWRAVERMFSRGNYAAYGYYDDDQLLAYTGLYYCEKIPYVLMDFFAVIDGLRGQGIGTAFLRDLLPEIKDVNGIFVEAVSASPAVKDKAEQKKREDRISFYRNAGAAVTGICCRLFSVNYDLLYFAENKEIDDREEYFKYICRMYNEMYRQVYGRLCKPYYADD